MRVVNDYVSMITIVTMYEGGW